MGKRALSSVFVVVALAAACGKSGPAHVGPNGEVARIDFEDPAQRMLFDNPARTEEAGFSFGEWLVEGGVLKQKRGASDNLANHLRYRGDAFGSPDGQAPSRYGVALDIAAYQETESRQVHGSPTGILGFMPYYKDPTHYVILVAARQSIEVWNVAGLRAAGEAWPQEARLHYEFLPYEIKVGDTVHWQAEVDTGAKTIRVWFGDDEAPRATVTVPEMDDAPHYVALAANGNFVAFDNLALFFLEKRKGPLGL